MKYETLDDIRKILYFDKYPPESPFPTEGMDLFYNKDIAKVIQAAYDLGCRRGVDSIPTKNIELDPSSVENCNWQGLIIAPVSSLCSTYLIISYKPETTNIIRFYTEGAEYPDTFSLDGKWRPMGRILLEDSKQYG